MIRFSLSRRLVSRSSPALLVAKRWNSTRLSNEEIISNSNWKSSNYFTRLGIPSPTSDMDVVKRHYHVLAGHFHPDSPNGSTEAFVEIRKAFDGLNEQNGFRATGSSSSTGRGDDGNNSSSSSSHPNMNDGKRRSEMSRAYGDAVPLFLVGCLALMLFMYYHNKHRLGSGYLSHLLVIFVVLQFFPRVLAALILFSFHCRDLLLLQKSTSQHKTVVQIEKSSQQPGKVTVSVLGIAEEDARHCTMETIVEEHQKGKEGAITRSSIVTAKGSPLSATLSFNSSSTKGGAPVQCYVKVVQEDTKVVLTDTVVTLA